MIQSRLCAVNGEEMLIRQCVFLLAEGTLTSTQTHHLPLNTLLSDGASLLNITVEQHCKVLLKCPIMLFWILPFI